MLKNYQDIESLMTDESFLAWHYRTDERAVREWDQWIAADDRNRRLAEEAVLLLNIFRDEEAIVTDEQTLIAERRIMGEINMLEPVKQKSRNFFTMHRFRAVAAITLIVASVLFLKLAFFSKSDFSTAYGEMKMQLLPDGTEVLLNANSKISFNDNWKEESTRDVWIDGEAFFHVKKTASRSKFILHTKQFDVQVTGTKFNVMDREGKSNVLLEEGQVILKMHGGREIVMKPGDFLEIDGKSVEKKNNAGENITAWKEKKIVFDNTPLTEAVRIIKEHYGVKVKIADGSLESSTLTGIMPNDNLEILLEAMSALNEFKIEQKNDTIIITRVPS